MAGRPLRRARLLAEARRNPAEHPYWAFSRWVSAGFPRGTDEDAVARAVGRRWTDAVHARGADPGFWEGEIEEQILNKFGAPPEHA